MNLNVDEAICRAVGAARAVLISVSRSVSEGVLTGLLLVDGNPVQTPG